ncbi:MAG: hypothetical protein IJE74_05910 [Clostridia bacterium]|nr:hypothetical protein [Clostridia bacterium]
MKKAKSILALLMAFVMLMSFAVTGFAATTAEEKEPNDAKETATAFGFGTEINGVLGEATDKDFYSFTSNAAGLATVTLEHDKIAGVNENLAYFAVVITNAEGKEIASFKSTGADEATTSPSFAIDAAATYYIKVEMGTVHSEALGYSLTASFDKGAYTEKEPNDSPSKATALELSKSGSAKHYYGTISPVAEGAAADVDYYRVAPTAAGVIYLYLYNGSVRGDYKATLYAYKDTDAAALDDMIISEIEINSNEDSKISVAIGVGAKEYMLKVEGVNGTTGGYRTRVFFEAAKDAEQEFNNNTSRADSIAIGEALRGTVSYKNDVDVFKFKAAGSNNGYDISLGSYNAASKAEGTWYISVIDGESNAPVKNADKAEVKAGKATVISTEALTAGRTYYIVIEKGATLNTEIYQLKLSSIVVEDDSDDKDDELSFGDQISVYWGQFWKNFEGWFEQIDIPAIISSIAQSVATVFTLLFSMS